MVGVNTRKMYTEYELVLGFPAGSTRGSPTKRWAQAYTRTHTGKWSARDELPTVWFFFLMHCCKHDCQERVSFQDRALLQVANQ